VTKSLNPQVTLTASKMVVWTWHNYGNLPSSHLPTTNHCKVINVQKCTVFIGN